MSGWLFHFVREAPWWQVLIAIIVAFGALHLIQVVLPAAWRSRHQTTSAIREEDVSARPVQPEAEDPSSPMFRIRGGSGFDLEDNLSVSHDEFLDAEDASDLSAKGNRSFRRGGPDYAADREGEDDNKKDGEHQQ